MSEQQKLNLVSMETTYMQILGNGKIVCNGWVNLENSMWTLGTTMQLNADANGVVLLFNTSGPDGHCPVKT